MLEAERVRGLRFGAGRGEAPRLRSKRAPAVRSTAGAGGLHVRPWASPRAGFRNKAREATKAKP